MGHVQLIKPPVVELSTNEEEEQGSVKSMGRGEKNSWIWKEKRDKKEEIEGWRYKRERKERSREDMRREKQEEEDREF